MFVDGSLIPSKSVANGNSIRQVRMARVATSISRWKAHDVVLANGLPCETLLETGTTTTFNNRPADLHSRAPLHTAFNYLMWETLGYAELRLAARR